MGVFWGWQKVTDSKWIFDGFRSSCIQAGGGGSGDGKGGVGGLTKSVTLYLKLQFLVFFSILVFC